MTHRIIGIDPASQSETQAGTKDYRFQPHRIIGIDPGLSGGLCLLEIAGGTILAAVPMPTVSLNRKGEIDLAALGALLTEWRPSVCWIEEQQAMPGQGVSSSYRTGYNYGLLRALIFARGIPINPVRPATWKKAVGVPSDKNAARAIASRIFPAHSHLWAKVKDDGLAEAALIALYGSRRA